MRADGRYYTCDLRFDAGTHDNECGVTSECAAQGAFADAMPVWRGYRQKAPKADLQTDAAR